MDLKVAREKYRHQKAQAKQRKILFIISFDEWCSVWEQSGKWEQRGCRKGQYVMSRIGDIGPYSVTNVLIKSNADNLREAHIGKPSGMKGKIARNKGISPNSITIEKMRNVALNRPKVQCPYCDKIGVVNMMKRWHFDKCKSLINDK